MRALLLVLMLAAPAHAVVLDDPEGDLETRWFDQDVAPYDNPQEDLVRLEVVEDAEGFAFALAVAGAPPDIDVLGSTFLFVHLRHGEQAYRFAFGDARIAPSLGFQDPEVTLYRVHEDGAETVQHFPLERTETTFSWWAPRALFIDESGAAPRVGGALTDIHAGSGGRSHLLVGPVNQPYRASQDRLPDNGGGVLDIVYGLTQRGAALDSAEPFRVSNGESGRFYYNVSLRADDDGLFTFAIKGLPNGWQVRLPFQELEVRRGETRSFLVEVTVPFAHQHGGRASFVLEAIADDAIGRLEMGMHYVDTPQPSGHHPRVWLHGWNPFGSGDPLGVLQSRDESTWPYLNALEEDPADMGGTIEPTQNGLLDFGSVGDAYRVGWIIPLRPGLRMGLNVTDAERPAELSIDTPRALAGAQILGGLYVWRDGQPTQIAALSSDPTDLPAGGGTLEATVTGEAGVIAYQPGQSLTLEVYLAVDEPMFHEAHTAPYLRTVATWFELPLAEYSDSIADASGFVQATPSEAEVQAFEEPQQMPQEDSPGLTLGLLLGALLALARKRQ